MLLRRIFIFILPLPENADPLSGQFCVDSARAFGAVRLLVLPATFVLTPCYKRAEVSAYRERMATIPGGENDAAAHYCGVPFWCVPQGDTAPPQYGVGL